MKKSYLLTSLIAAAAVLSNTNVFADDASDIESDSPGSTVTYDNYSGNYPVVTAVLSAAGAKSGTHTYSSWSFLANDGTGSIDIYAYSTTLTLGSGPALYSPTVGDQISLTGTYEPYNQIPEIGTSKSPSQPTVPITLQSQGNLGAVPAPTPVTVNQVNVGTLPLNYAGYLLQLNNVTIGGTVALGGTGGTAGGLFPTYAQATVANETFTVTDGTGTMTLFDWVTSYSTDGAMGGYQVPTGTVPYIDGFVDIYTPTSGIETPQPEFVPTYIPGLELAVPEPSVLNLLGVGGAGSLLALISRFRKKV
jgi:hypothetical protein